MVRQRARGQLRTPSSFRSLDLNAKLENSLEYRPRISITGVMSGQQKNALILVWDLGQNNAVGPFVHLMAFFFNRHQQFPTSTLGGIFVA